MGRLRTPAPLFGAPPERVSRTAATGDRAEQNKAADRWRGSAKARGYDARWAKASRQHQAEHPLCEYCERGVFGPMRCVAVQLTDHLYPARDYPHLFWERANWVSSCRSCHDIHKQALERTADRDTLDDLARRLAREPLAA